VHKVLGGQVDHPGRDLAGDVQHLGHAQLPVGLQGLSVNQDQGVRPVGSADRTQGGGRENGDWDWIGGAGGRKTELIVELLHNHGSH